MPISALNHCRPLAIRLTTAIVFEHLGRQSRDVVELRLQRRVEDCVAFERGETVDLASGLGRHQTVTLER